MINKSVDSDFITLKDFYKEYPYPCYDVTSNTVPMAPYISKSKVVCDNKYSLSKREWMLIVKSYLKHLSLYILSGNVFKMPERMGLMEVRKYKAKKVDVQASLKAKKRVYHKNLHTGGYTIVWKWFRGSSQSSLLYKWHWEIRPMKKLNQLVNKFLKGDPSRINRINKTI